MTNAQQLKRAWVCVCAGFAVACSGGGGDGAAPASTGSPPPANNPPTISGSPATMVTVGQAYSFTPTANDTDGDALTFSIVNQPVWANLDSSTGALTGTPTSAHIGTTVDVTVSVSDGNASAALAPFDLTVQQSQPPPNSPPTISGSPATTVTEGQAYSFTPTANDADGDPLTFSIINQPVWANFDSSTGALTGTPTSVHIGTTVDVTVSVSDGNASAALAPFDLVVQQSPPANNPPTISGAPATTVTEGQAYSFTPTANDADSDPLTFSIVNQPAWANFDTATGALTGTPTAMHIGTTVGVTISVADGTASVSLPAFNLTVQAVQLGSATVSWDVPTTNADGSLLTDLAGYQVHYGTSSGNYSSIALVNDPNATDVTISSLQPGTWFFAVKAVDQTGNASTFSVEVSKVIP